MRKFLTGIFAAATLAIALAQPAHAELEPKASPAMYARAIYTALDLLWPLEENGLKFPALSVARTVAPLIEYAAEHASSEITKAKLVAVLLELSYYSKLGPIPFDVWKQVVFDLQATLPAERVKIGNIHDHEVDIEELLIKTALFGEHFHDVELRYDGDRKLAIALLLTVVTDGRASRWDPEVAKFMKTDEPRSPAIEGVIPMPDAEFMKIVPNVTFVTREHQIALRKKVINSETHLPAYEKDEQALKVVAALRELGKRALKSKLPFRPLVRQSDDYAWLAFQAEGVQSAWLVTGFVRTFLGLAKGNRFIWYTGYAMGKGLNRIAGADIKGFDEAAMKLAKNRWLKRLDGAVDKLKTLSGGKQSWLAFEKDLTASIHKGVVSEIKDANSQLFKSLPRFDAKYAQELEGIYTTFSADPAKNPSYWLKPELEKKRIESERARKLSDTADNEVKRTKSELDTARAKEVETKTKFEVLDGKPERTLAEQGALDQAGAAYKEARTAEESANGAYQNAFKEWEKAASEKGRLKNIVKRMEEANAKIYTLPESEGGALRRMKLVESDPEFIAKPAYLQSEALQDAARLGLEGPEAIRVAEVAAFKGNTVEKLGVRLLNKVKVGIPKLGTVMAFAMIAFCIYDVWETQKQIDNAQTWEQREEALLNQRISIFQNGLYAYPIIGEILVCMDVVKFTLVSSSDVFRLATKFSIPGLGWVKYFGSEPLARLFAEHTVLQWPADMRFQMLLSDYYKKIDLKPLWRDKDRSWALRDDALEAFEKVANETGEKDEAALKVLAEKRSEYSLHLAEYAHKNLQLIYELTAVAHPLIKFRYLNDYMDSLIVNWSQLGGLLNRSLTAYDVADAKLAGLPQPKPKLILDPKTFDLGVVDLLSPYVKPQSQR